MTEETGRSGPVAIGEDFDRVFAELRALRDLAGRAEQTGDNSGVYGFSIEWGMLLAGRLHRLTHYYEQGSLSFHDASRYDALWVELRAAVPLMDQVGLPRPPEPPSEAL